VDDVDYDRRAYNLEKGLRTSWHEQVLPQPRRQAPTDLNAVMAASDLL
jgi:hypothetical protein